MKKLKIIAVFLVLFLLGIILIITFGENIRRETDIEVFFYLWLLLLPTAVGFVTGMLYPQQPLPKGARNGLVLASMLVLFLLWFSPLFAVPVFLLIITAGAVAISTISAFLGAVFHRARLILAQREKTETSGDNS